VVEVEIEYVPRTLGLFVPGAVAYTADPRPGSE
jgi:hypothetical protein